MKALIRRHPAEGGSRAETAKDPAPVSRRGTGSRSLRSSGASTGDRQRLPMIAGDAVVEDLSGQRLAELGCALPASLLALNLSHNALASFSALGARSLVELNLSHNRLETLDGIGAALALEFLDASHNRLTHLEGLAALSKLRFLALRGNLLTSLTGVAILAFNTALSELVLLDNPCSLLPDYRVSVFNALRSLVLLDGRVEPKRVDGYRQRYELAGASQSAHLAVSIVDAAALAKILGLSAKIQTPAVKAADSTPTTVVLPGERGRNKSASKAPPDSAPSQTSRKPPSTRSQPGSKAAQQSKAARPNECWMSPMVSRMRRASLSQPQDADCASTLAIAALSMHTSRDGLRSPAAPAVNKRRDESPPVSPTRLSSERKAYKDLLLQRRRRELDDHEARLFGRSPPRTPRPGAGSLRSASPLPSPTRASLRRQERVAEDISRRQQLLEDHSARTPPPSEKRFFGSDADLSARSEIRSEIPVAKGKSPPPSPTRASLRRQSHVREQIRSRDEREAAHRLKSEGVQSSGQRSQTFAPRFTSARFLRKGGPEDNGSDRDDADGDSVTVLLQRLIRSKSDTLELLRCRSESQ